MLLDERNKVQIDTVFKYENFKEEVRKFFSEKDIQCGNLLENKLNSVQKKHYSHYYDEELIQAIEKVCKPDIDYFKYTYEEPCR